MPTSNTTKSVADDFSPTLSRPCPEEILTAQRFIAHEVYFFGDEEAESSVNGISNRVVNAARLFLSANDRWTHAGFLWAIHDLHRENLVQLRRAKIPLPNDAFRKNTDLLLGLGYSLNGKKDYPLGHFVVQTTDALRAYREQNPVTTHELARLPPDAIIHTHRQPDGFRGHLNMDVTTALEFVYWLNSTIFINELVNKQTSALKQPSTGELVHNAFLLADELRIPELGKQPTGEFTLEAELRELRNIRRHLRETCGVTTDRLCPENPELEQRLDKLLGIHTPCVQEEPPKPKKKRGRRRGSRTYDLKDDKRVYDAHQTNGNRYATTARALGRKEEDVRSAVERHRKRLSRN